MKAKKPILVKLILVTCFLFSLMPVHSAEPPQNIIFFLGDGMGTSHITAAKIVNESLNLERFKTLGLSTTHASDRLITDSAAAMTALMTGEKSYNGAISVSPDFSKLKTLFEYAEDAGKSTGLVATCTVTHATPACCVAHVDSRNKHSEIAEQITGSDLEVIMGGGWAYFAPSSRTGSKRQDDKDLLAELQTRMPVLFSTEEMHQLKTPEALAVFLAPVNPPGIDERTFSLAELTSKAIEVLSQNEKGFVLMVEGSQIDWAGHDNRDQDLVYELIDFDEAVGVGLDFAVSNKKTLVVVTADHETGGFAIHGGSIDEKSITDSGFTCGHHTGTMVPVFAYGPGEKRFSGILDNTTIGKHLIDFYETE